MKIDDSMMFHLIIYQIISQNTIARDTHNNTITDKSVPLQTNVFFVP